MTMKMASLIKVQKLVEKTIGRRKAKGHEQRKSRWHNQVFFQQFFPCFGITKNYT